MKNSYCRILWLVLFALPTLAAQTAQLSVVPHVSFWSGQPQHPIVRPDGTIIVSGLFAGNEGDPFSNLVLLDSNGRLLKRLPPLLYPHDAGSYNRPQYSRCDAALEDGSFIVETEFYISIGTYGETTSRPLHVNADGSVDEGFTARFGTNAPAWQTAVQSDGKLLFAGAFDGVPIRRTFQDGSPDPEFTRKVALATLPPIGLAMALGSSGKIWLWPGEFSISNGYTLKQLVLLNSDGSRDLGFAPTTFTNAWMLGAQPDGKLLLGRPYGHRGDDPIIVMSRLNEDGSLDTGFNVDTNLLAGFNLWYTYIDSFAIMPGGNIVIGLNSSRGRGPTTIKRLLSDGRLDPTFNDQLRAEWIFELVPLSSGKLLVLHGEMLGTDPTAQSLARLNQDGSVDSSFDASAAAASYIGSVEVGVAGGRKGFRYAFQASTDLREWRTVYKIGPIQFDPGEISLGFLDADAGRFRQRFYRVVETAR